MTDEQFDTITTLMERILEKLESIAIDTEDLQDIKRHSSNSVGYLKRISNS